jgi:hypothetical protein
MKINNIREVQTGIFIKICDNPAYSISRYGGLEGYKKTLAGTIQKVKQAFPSENRIYIVPPPECGHYDISFNICDVRKIEEKDLNIGVIEPVMFDPNQLDI